MERRYHVITLNEKTGRKVYNTATPVTHEEGCTILRKMRPYPTTRHQLEDVTTMDKRRTVTIYQDKHDRWVVFDGQHLRDEAFPWFDEAQDWARTEYPDAVIASF
jgi:hypothetical protein